MFKKRVLNFSGEMQDWIRSIFSSTWAIRFKSEFNVHLNSSSGFIVELVSYRNREIVAAYYWIEKSGHF